MKQLKNPMVSSFWFAMISSFYAAVLIISSRNIANHMLLTSDNLVANLIQNGAMRFIGFTIITFAIAVDILSALRREKYDEYQVSMLKKSMIWNGLCAAILFPFIICTLIFLPKYCIEIIIILFILQWLIMAASKINYLFKNYRN